MDIERLLSILQDEEKVYKQMLELCKEETKVLVAGNVTRLDEIVQRQSHLIAQLGRAEMERVRCIGYIAEELNMEADKVTVSVLIEKIPEPQASDLKGIQNRLNGMLDEFRRLNELNSQLIKSSIEFIDYTLGLLLDICQETSYDADGRVQGLRYESAVLDQRV